MVDRNYRHLAPVAIGLLLGVLASVSVLSLWGASLYIPQSPTAKMQTAISDAVQGKPMPRFSDAELASIIEASAWYRAVAFPFFAGSILGILLALARRRGVSRVEAAVAFGVYLLFSLSLGTVDTLKVMGSVGFLFCLVGGSGLIMGERAHRRFAAQLDGRKT